MSWFLTMLFPESVPPGLADEARSRGLRLVTGAQLPVLVRGMFGGVRSLDAVTLVTTASLEDVSDEVLLPPVEPFDWDAQLQASTASLQRVAGLLEAAVLRAGSVEVAVHDGFCLPEEFIRVDTSPADWVDVVRRSVLQGEQRPVWARMLSGVR